MANAHDTASMFTLLVDEEKRAHLLTLRGAVEPILANNLLPHFTDHSVVHSDSVASLIDELAAPLQKTERALQSGELFVLYAAAYLHDLGMQYENAGSTETITSLKLDQAWEDLTEDTRRLLIRQYHHRISAELVQASVRSAAPPIGALLPSDLHPDAIAGLCHAHAIAVDSEEYRDVLGQQPELRMPLLSGLLRVADILDESRRRAQRERARTLLLDLEAQAHWWRHYYTSSVQFDHDESRIVIWFDFPSARLDEYGKIVPALQLPEIEAELRRHESAFAAARLNWVVRHKIVSSPYDNTEEMPDSVLASMLKQLRARQMREAEEQRQRTLAVLSEARPHLQERLSRLASLERTLSSDKYLRMLFGVADDMKDLGGVGSAWLMAEQALRKHGGELPAPQRLDYAMSVAAWMLDNGRPVEASRFLNGLRETANETGVTVADRAKFWARLAVCLTEACAYSDAVDALNEAVSLTSDPAVVERLRAELSELHMLQGEFRAAIRTTPDEVSRADA